MKKWQFMTYDKQGKVVQSIEAKAETMRTVTLYAKKVLRESTKGEVRNSRVRRLW